MAGTAVISTIKHDVSGSATTFKDGAGNEIRRLCSHWVFFSASPAVGESFNISSVTKSSTGDFYTNFAMSYNNQNYGMIGAVNEDAGLHAIYQPTQPETGRIRIRIFNSSNSSRDCSYNWSGAVK